MRWAPAWRTSAIPIAAGAAGPRLGTRQVTSVGQPFVGAPRASGGLVNRARGMAAEMRARCQEEAVPDEVLEERVRSKLGHIARYPEGIEVTARVAP